MNINAKIFYGIFYNKAWYISPSKKEQGDVYFELICEKTYEKLTCPFYPSVGSVVAVTSTSFNYKIISSKIIANKIDFNIRGYHDIIKQLRLEKLNNLEIG